MGYLHINNLYRAEGQDILLFKECYAMEKIHGTSCHVSFNSMLNEIKYFSGGEKHERFVSLFNEEDLKQRFLSLGSEPNDVVIFGEGAGGKQQGMSHTYGPNLFFVAFDVKLGNNWLDVPKAELICKSLGIEFVHYTKVPTDIAALNAERDADSVQAIRKGMGPGKKREGVVLRPLMELKKNNGDRIICKHKRDEFMETKTPRPVVDPEKAKILVEAEAIADEWVVPMRLEHVLQRIPDHNISKMRDIILLMIEDVNREGSGEFVPSLATNKAISNKTVELYKKKTQL